MPLPNDYALPKTEKREFEPMESDVYECVVKDIEKKISFYKSDEGEDVEVFSFTFAVAEGSNQGRLLWKEVKPYCFYGDKGASVLLSIVNAVAKRDLSKEEADAIGAAEINDLIGKNLRLTVSKEPNKQGVMKNKVKGFLPSKLAPKEAEVKVEDIPF